MSLPSERKDLVISASRAISRIFAQSHQSDFEVCGNCIIELCSEFGLDDNELIEALELSGGTSVEEDDFIDEMINRIK